MNETAHEIFFIGDAGVGKTAIIGRIIDNQFNEVYVPTNECNSNLIDYRGQSVKIWDMPGQEDYIELIPKYVKQSSVVFLIYDVSAKSSFKNIYKWLNKIKDIGKLTIILIGNKKDIKKKEISKEEGEEFSKKEEIPFFEISAKKDENIANLFYNVIKELLEGNKVNENILINNRGFGINSQERKDAQALRKALEGSKTDDEKLIDIAGKRTHKERLKIRQEYKAMFGRDLMSDLKSDLSGNYKLTMLALFTDPVEYDADNLYKAMKGAGTDEDTLIEILSSRPGWYINKIKKVYKEKYKQDLEEDVVGDTSNNFRKLLVSLLQCKRSRNERPNKDECEKMAKELYNAGEKRLGTDEPVFNKIFALSSPHELICISREYHKLTGNTLITAIENEFSGDIKKLLKTVLYVLISPHEYFATRIHDAIVGLGTNEKILTRVMVTRGEIDLPKIKQYYKKLYGKDMLEEIKDDVSGNYKKILVAIYNQY